MAGLYRPKGIKEWQDRLFRYCQLAIEVIIALIIDNLLIEVVQVQDKVIDYFLGHLSPFFNPCF
jgi:hypothetical protein